MTLKPTYSKIDFYVGSKCLYFRQGNVIILIKLLWQLQHLCLSIAFSTSKKFLLKLQLSPLQIMLNMGQNQEREMLQFSSGRERGNLKWEKPYLAKESFSRGKWKLHRNCLPKSLIFFYCKKDAKIEFFLSRILWFIHKIDLFLFWEGHRSACFPVCQFCK